MCEIELEGHPDPHQIWSGDTSGTIRVWNADVSIRNFLEFSYIVKIDFRIYHGNRRTNQFQNFLFDKYI